MNFWKSIISHHQFCILNWKFMCNKERRTAYTRMHSHQIPVSLFLPTAIGNWILIIWQWIQWNEMNEWRKFFMSSAHKRLNLLSTYRKSRNLDLKIFNRWPHPNNSSIYIHMYTYMQIRFFMFFQQTFVCTFKAATTWNSKKQTKKFSHYCRNWKYYPRK